MIRLFIAYVAVVLQVSGGAIMFWNLENFFDPFDDPTTVDEDFTPRGSKHWSWKMFVQKRNGIAKTILAASDACGEGDGAGADFGTGAVPDIVCFAEVENFMVLHQLVEETPLTKLDYGIVHRDSPDRRGIDVAMIFRKSRVRILAVDSLRVPVSGSGSGSGSGSRSGTGSPTRDILYVKCLRLPSDTLHLFVNHWPSKRGGASVSASRRLAAASVLRGAVDSILAISPSANVLACGDFNDTPSSVAPLLAPALELVPARMPAGVVGTIKYRGVWEQIDQFYISPGSPGSRRQMLIFAPDFLLESDPQYTGVRPRRTYLGPRWHEGLSDHLPILLLP